MGNPELLRVWHLGEEACRPGHSFGPAVRNHYLIHYIIRGRGVFRTGGKAYTLGAGQAFLIVPGAVTEYTADAADPWQYAWVGFHGTSAPEWLAMAGASAREPILTSSDPAASEAALAQLRTAADSAAGALAMNGALLALLATLRGCAMAQPTDGSYLIDAVDYIGQNYSYRITVAEIAKAVNVSRSALFRAFKRTYGVSPQTYLLRIRLSAAADYLCTTELSVTEIAYSCGFTDANHFSKIFLQKKHLSPTQYRTQYRQGAFRYESQQAD